MKRLSGLRKKNVELITDARQSPLENWKKRKKIYNIMQGSRIPLLLLSALAYLGMHNMWLSAIFIFLSVPMPWVAVVIANGVGEPHDSRKKQVYKPQAARDAARMMQTQLDQAKQQAALPTVIIDEDGNAAETASSNEASDVHVHHSSGMFSAAPSPEPTGQSAANGHRSDSSAEAGNAVVEGSVGSESTEATESSTPVHNGEQHQPATAIIIDHDEDDAAH